ncbi:NAD(P)H-dependent oxidoreductase [Williamsia serinedens]|uniref:NAD(P)H dehydrogenase (Quinone) n=1 Tax=Williamsia serinedens TaxID=391736 RepID=A0ABT1GXU5_9NOCA|nr:NAD(P)H-dependent oxidoreductase [Williamsia serinedens]MCP2159372.1 NAD(P)H dehydrogenase (quinone) [Williamsia serinedens]
MTALVVVAHPDPGSLTHHVARSVAASIHDRGEAAQIADLAAEGFDPRFSLADRRRYRDAGPLPADVRAEQARLDGVDDLVLVFPVYWRSMPALLKGWVDRVFVRGWAFDDRAVPFRRLLGHLTVHMVMVAGEDADGFRRRGYDVAMTTQIETGVLGYCGMNSGVIATVHESDTADGEVLAARVEEIADAVGRRAVATAADVVAG